MIDGGIDAIYPQSVRKGENTIEVFLRIVAIADENCWRNSRQRILHERNFTSLRKILLLKTKQRRRRGRLRSTMTS